MYIYIYIYDACDAARGARSSSSSASAAAQQPRRVRVKMWRCEGRILATVNVKDNNTKGKANNITCGAHGLCFYIYTIYIIYYPYIYACVYDKSEWSKNIQADGMCVRCVSALQGYVFYVCARQEKINGWFYIILYIYMYCILVIYIYTYTCM